MNVRTVQNGYQLDEVAKDQLSLVKRLPDSFSDLSLLLLYDEGANDYEELNAAFGGTLTPLVRLKRVSLTTRLSSVITIALLRLPALEAPRRSWRDGPLDFKLCWRLNSHSSLKPLELMADLPLDGSTCSLILDVASTHSLPDLRINLYPELNVTNVEPFLRAVALRIDMRHLSLAGSTVNELTDENLELLQACGALEYLELETEVSRLPVSDAGVENLMKHPPRLKQGALMLKDGSEPQLTLRHCFSSCNAALALKALRRGRT
ncbi:hypothetical protein FRB97_006754 [Tulasnella sp. 331]|nr:hypothetical protein FRB97_006754 [Tulasnella sp. 331]